MFEANVGSPRQAAAAQLQTCSVRGVPLQAALEALLALCRLRTAASGADAALRLLQERLPLLAAAPPAAAARVWATLQACVAVAGTLVSDADLRVLRQAWQARRLARRPRCSLRMHRVCHLKAMHQMSAPCGLQEAAAQPTLTEAPGWRRVAGSGWRSRGGHGRGAGGRARAAGAGVALLADALCWSSCAVAPSHCVCRAHGVRVCARAVALSFHPQSPMGCFSNSKSCARRTESGWRLRVLQHAPCTSAPGSQSWQGCWRMRPRRRLRALPQQLRAWGLLRP